jgi:serine/threonine-protein kinase RsbW
MVKRLSKIPHGVSFPSTQKLLSAVDRFLERELRKAGVSADAIADLAISVSELVNNAILHGNRQDESKKVTLELHPTPGEVTVYIEDEGEGFDPEKVANPLEEQNILKEVGRGIFIIRSLVDSVEFGRGRSGGMRVKLVKKFTV